MLAYMITAALQLSMLQESMEKLLNPKSRKDKRMKLLVQNRESQSTINLKENLMFNNNQIRNILVII